MDETTMANGEIAGDFYRSSSRRLCYLIGHRKAPNKDFPKPTPVDQSAIATLPTRGRPSFIDLDVQHSSPDGNRNSMGPVVRLKFVQNVLDVKIDSVFGKG